MLDADSFLMKGEAPKPITTWRGNPAKAVRSRTPRDGAGGTDERDGSDPFLPAMAA